MGLELVGGKPMYRVWGCGEHVENGVKAKDTSALFELDMAARVAVAVWYVDSQGGSVRHSEGFRPTGSERPDRFVTSASKTSLGMSTQWFQVGRMDRGETPSAIIPRPDGSNASAHNRGRAWDSNAPTARDMRLRAEGCALVGLVFNVASESWHCEPLGTVPSSVDLGPWIKFVQGVVTPAKPATPSTPLHVREDTMRIYQQNDTKDGKVFAFDGGAVWIGPDELKDIADANRRSGITGPGFTEPLPMPSAQITRLSETARKANGTYIVRDRIVEVLRQIGAKLGVKID